MKPEVPLSGGDEYDALSRARHIIAVFSNRTGLVRRMQRKYWKRVRQYVRCFLLNRGER